MRKVLIYSIIIFMLLNSSNQDLQEDILKKINSSNKSEKYLSRKRRYLTFPAGSSLQLVYCLTMPSVGVGEIFTFGATAALAWELPSTAEEVLELSGKKKPTTTTEPPTTTLPPLIHDEDPHHSFDDYKNDDPSERIDKPSKYFSGSWAYKHKYPGPAKSYYNPFLISKPYQYGYTSDLKNIRQTYTSQNGYNSNSNYRPKQLYNELESINSYVHPEYYQIHRRTRRDLYGKIEKLFTALSKDGKGCLLKAICEVSQVAEGKGTFMEEIIKAIFRIKPHEQYPDEDDYDTAANKKHDCTEQYPTCDNSVWKDMF